MPSSSPKPSPSFEFFKLPPELRNHIYNFALISEIQPVHHRYPHQIPLCNAFPQILHEAYPIYLTSNNFLLYNSSYSTNWLRSIGPASRAAPLRLTIRKLSKAPKEAKRRLFLILSSCLQLNLTIISSLKTLERALNNGGLAPIHGFDSAWVSILPRREGLCQLHRRFQNKENNAGQHLALPAGLKMRQGLSDWGKENCLLWYGVSRWDSVQDRLMAHLKSGCEHGCEHGRRRRSVVRVLESEGGEGSYKGCFVCVVGGGVGKVIL